MYHKHAQSSEHCYVPTNMLSPRAELVWQALLRKHIEEFGSTTLTATPISMGEVQCGNPPSDSDYKIQYSQPHSKENRFNLQRELCNLPINSLDQNRRFICDQRLELQRNTCGRNVQISDSIRKQTNMCMSEESMREAGQSSQEGLFPVNETENVAMDYDSQPSAAQPFTSQNSERVDGQPSPNIDLDFDDVISTRSVSSFDEENIRVQEFAIAFNGEGENEIAVIDPPNGKHIKKQEEIEVTGSPFADSLNTGHTTGISLPLAKTGDYREYFSKQLLVKRTKKHKKEETEADRSLSSIEQIMERKSVLTAPTKSKRPKFIIPPERAKKEGSSKATISHPQVKEDEVKQKHRFSMKSVSHLSLPDRALMETALLGAKEVAMTLVYSDGSSQLRPPEETGRKKTNTKPVQLEGVAIIYPYPECQGDITIDHIFIPVNEPHQTSTEVLRKVMGSKIRKICFGTYNFIIALMKGYQFEESEVISWSVLDPVVAHWLYNSDHPAKSFGDLIKTTPNVSREPQENNIVQSCKILEDLKLLGPIMASLYSKLKSANLWKIFLHLETPLIPVLAAMHVRGMRVDTQELNRMGNILERKLAQLEEEAHMAACKRFSLNSHAQLRQIIFEDLQLDKKLPPGSKIAKTLVGGQKSTSEAVLQQLKGTHHLPLIVLEHRQLQKLKSTYTDGILACAKNGWLHPHWDQVSAATGRLASTQPNIQAVPKQPVNISVVSKTIIGKEPEMVSLYARDPFICKDGFVLLSADFQQIEFRLLAHLSSDPAILKIFTEDRNTDIFVQLTAQWLGKSECDVTSADREQAKHVVYSVMYGVGKERLAEYLKISQDFAKGIIQSFLVTYPGINAFSKSCIEEARKKGYQTTIFGRRRQLPHITHPAPQLRAQAERQAVNFCVQGSAADICKTAMVQMEHALALRVDLDARVLVQIHDELLFEVRAEQIDQVAELARSIMEDADSLCGGNMKLAVPLSICLATGKKWGHLRPYTKGGSEP